LTPAALLIQIGGLSHREAADFLRVRLDTVQSWHRSRNPTQARDGVIAELRGLIARQETAAAQATDQIAALAGRHGAPTEIEIGYPADDHEAQDLGWPCVGAWRAMAARVVAAAPIKIILVPRGSTPGTAAAADAREAWRNDE
jgi:hypothetical protein